MQFEDTGNSSLLFQKMYYHGFEWSRHKEEKYSMPFFKKRLDWIRNVKLEVPKYLSILPATEIILKTIYPGLTTGIGVNHESGSVGEIKLGFEFDFTSGMPVVRGHSLKGMLRSAFPQNSVKESKFKMEKAFQIHCWLHNVKFTKKGLDAFKEDDKLYTKIVEIEHEIFDGVSQGKLLPMYDQDVFFDSYILSASKFHGTKDKYLSDDYITPHVHKGLSYEESMLRDPNIIPFLKILPGIEIAFRFKLHDNGLLTVDEKKDLFTSILLETGIGAKTNVGYGQLEQV